MGAKKGNTFSKIIIKKYLDVKFDFLLQFPVVLVRPRHRRRRQKRPQAWEDSSQLPYWRNECTQVMNFYSHTQPPRHEISRREKNQVFNFHFFV